MATLDLETVACDLCGGADEEFLFTKAGVLTGYPFRVVRCRDCGLIYLNPRLSAAAITDLYTTGYYEGRGFDRQIDYSLDRSEAQERPAMVLSPVCELMPAPARLLDFGCGQGWMLKKARTLGYDAEGYEISADGRANARSMGLVIYDDPREIPSASYDLAIATEVLEHCASPMAALREIHRSLKPGGLFYYTTGNFDGFYRRWKAGRPDQPSLDYIMPEGHIYFFSPEVMCRYFQTIGFSRQETWRSNRYNQAGPLYRGLRAMHLAGPGDYPASWIQSVAHRVGRSITTGVTGQPKPLPIAWK